MTATNKCYNFVGFRCRVPLSSLLRLCKLILVSKSLPMSYSALILEVLLSSEEEYILLKMLLIWHKIYR